MDFEQAVLDVPPGPPAVEEIITDFERAVLDVLPDPPAVEEIVMDFERAAWSTASRVVHDVHCQRCALHWGQAVWRKTQELGLRRAYLHDSDTFNFLRKLMALPLLPAEHITPCTVHIGTVI